MINISIEARMTSSRLPGKVLKHINKIPALELMINRIKDIKKIDNIIVATTTNKEDDPIISWCSENNIKYFRGSENNVYDRVLKSHQFYNTDIIIELSGDCPLLDPTVIEVCLETYLNGSYDYVSTGWSYPLGMAVEIFSLDSLQSVSKNRELTYEDKEHVSPYLYTSDKYKVFHVEAPKSLQCDGLSVTLDTIEDFEVIENICKSFTNIYFTLEDIVIFAKENPTLVLKNKNIHRKGLS